MTKLTHSICIIVCIISFMGCTSTRDRIYKQNDIPMVGEIRTMELGTQLVLQQDVLITPVRIVSQPTKYVGVSGTYNISGSFGRVNNGEQYCGSGVSVATGSVINRGSGVSSDNSIDGMINPDVCITDQEFRELKIPYTEGQEIIHIPTNFQRILEYAGKSGNTISLYYKEFNDTLIRPAFTQEFKFDLSESKIIGIKGARIEVIEANNTGIKYKVLNHFPR